MWHEKGLFKYTSVIKKKLILVSLVILLLYIAILTLLTELMFSLYFPVAILTALLPFVAFQNFYRRNRHHDNLVDKLAHCKYNPLFPFHFKADENPEKSKRINVDSIKSKIRAGDIVLRRYHHYLDGLIFSQNSYFTHVGIIDTDLIEGTPMVWHAEGKEGVHMTVLDDFLKCDNVAVLRFAFDTDHDALTVREDIIAENSSMHNQTEIKNRELQVFDILARKKRGKSYEGILNLSQKYDEVYSRLIVDQARALHHTPYDFHFDFYSYNSLSCIEYVWYCFKCLFPYHQIKVRDFEYFELIQMPVIIPDVFVQNRYFRYVYSSIPNVNNKKQLKKFVRGEDSQFWLFLLSILIWEILLLAVLHYACVLLKDVFGTYL